MGEDPLAARLENVRAGITEAAHAAGRDPGSITTIVVTKFQPASLVRRLAALGVREVGENRHQEARAKADELEGLGLHWHFVGQLQRNKAARVRRYAHVVHSVDRPGLLTGLSSADHELECFVQLNLTGDPGRGGVIGDGLEPLVEGVLDTPGLRLLGVMAVAPREEEPRAAFARVRAASERVRSLAPWAVAISAGMSHDYPQAVAEGATHLRIGTAITGKRPERR